MRIGAIIVSYEPNPDSLTALVRRVMPQVERLLVVDNGSSASKLARLRADAQSLGIALTELGENRGIATAHNVGFAWLRGQSCTHALLLDQDSLPAEDMVEHLKSALQSLYQAGEKVAAVGPRYVDPLSGHSSFFVRIGPLRFQKVYCSANQKNPIPVDFLISSGSLVPLMAIDVVGEMEDALFIDHVDTEWFLRATMHDLRAFGVCDAVMHHSLGDSTLSIWIGRWRQIAVHSPLRHYYTFRNSVLLYRRRYAPWRWIAGDLHRLLGMLIIFSLRSPERFKHIKMMLKGLWHGLNNVSGKYEPD